PAGGDPLLPPELPQGGPRLRPLGGTGRGVPPSRHRGRAAPQQRPDPRLLPRGPPGTRDRPRRRSRYGLDLDRPGRVTTARRRPPAPVTGGLLAGEESRWP